jgi:hypothetical protein
MILNIGHVGRTKALLSAWIGPKSYKRIGLVLAAGIGGPQNFGDLVGWKECCRVNMLGNVAVYSSLLPGMLENNFGRIVGFAGGGAAYAYPLFPAYAASKAAMVRTIENIQADLNGDEGYGVVEGRGRSYGRQRYLWGKRWAWMSGKPQKETGELVVETDGDDVFQKEISAIFLATPRVPSDRATERKRWRA